MIRRDDTMRLVRADKLRPLDVIRVEGGERIVSGTDTSRQDGAYVTRVGYAAPERLEVRGSVAVAPDQMIAVVGRWEVAP